MIHRASDAECEMCLWSWPCGAAANLIVHITWITYTQHCSRLVVLVYGFMPHTTAQPFIRLDNFFLLHFHSPQNCWITWYVTLTVIYVSNILVDVVDDKEKWFSMSIWFYGKAMQTLDVRASGNVQQSQSIWKAHAPRIRISLELNIHNVIWMACDRVYNTMYCSWKPHGSLTRRIFAAIMSKAHESTIIQSNACGNFQKPNKFHHNCNV